MKSLTLRLSKPLHEISPVPLCQLNPQSGFAYVIRETPFGEEESLTSFAVHVGTIGDFRDPLYLYALPMDNGVLEYKISYTLLSEDHVIPLGMVEGASSEDFEKVISHWKETLGKDVANTLRTVRKDGKEFMQLREVVPGRMFMGYGGEDFRECNFFLLDLITWGELKASFHPLPDGESFDFQDSKLVALCMDFHNSLRILSADDFVLERRDVTPIPEALVKELLQHYTDSEES